MSNDYILLERKYRFRFDNWPNECSNLNIYSQSSVIAVHGSNATIFFSSTFPEAKPHQSKNSRMNSRISKASRYSKKNSMIGEASH